jgi:rhodanese-related sulfurtransferase
VGVPVLTLLGKEALLAEWQSYPEMKTDPDFARNLANVLSARGAGKDDPVLFLCRSGGRSKSAAAALTQLGFTRAYNVLGGFEGDKDNNGHRGNLSGWKMTGLPWMQR